MNKVLATISLTNISDEPQPVTLVPSKHEFTASASVHFHYEVAGVPTSFFDSFWSMSAIADIGGDVPTHLHIGSQNGSSLLKDLVLLPSKRKIPCFNDNKGLDLLIAETPHSGEITGLSLVVAPKDTVLIKIVCLVKQPFMHSPLLEPIIRTRS